MPTWFNYIFTYKGDNAGKRGLIEAVILIVEEPYLISALLAVFLNATLSDDNEEVEGEGEGKEWNRPAPIRAREGEEVKV